jgi:hypothetical protein
MSFARDTLLIFRRQMRLSLRNPAWVIIGLIQPVRYRVLRAAAEPGVQPGAAIGFS